VWFQDAFLRRLERLRLLARRRKGSTLAPGERRAERRGQGLEVRGHRGYAAGDDFRDIDWSAFLRHERLYVREREDESAREVTVAVDTSGSMARQGKLELAKRLAAALAYVALAEDDTVVLATLTSGKVERSARLRGKAAILDAVRFLDGKQAWGDTALEASCRRASATSRRPGLAVLVTDFLDLGEMGRALVALRDGRRDLVAVHLVAPEDEAPDLSGDLELEDVETGAVVRVHANGDARAEYRQAFAEWTRELEGEARRQGGVYALVRASDDLEAAALSVLRKGGVVA
jgi:uncharacterized protein (DUF58 family)